MMNNIYDTTDLMVHGHVPWLELPGSHVHAGGTAEIRLYWGREMQPDGLLRRNNLTAHSLSPGGAWRDLALFDGGPDRYNLYFSAREDGIYHIVAKHCGSFIVDSEGNYLPGTRSERPDACQSACFIQHAQVFLPVGHHLAAKPLPVGILLEIVPDIWQLWQVGDEIWLQVQYNGKPLAASNVDLVCKGGPGGRRQWQETTDAEGRFGLLAREAGRYLVTARYHIEQGDAEFQNSLQIATTLSLMVLKKERQREVQAEHA